MQLDTLTSQSAVLEEISRAVEATWGAERVAALQPSLEATAATLWQIAQQPLDFTDVEPDFISAAEA